MISSRATSARISWSTATIPKGCSPGTTSRCCSVPAASAAPTRSRSIVRRTISCGSISRASTRTLAGYAIYGRVQGGEFVPYHSRADIETGALADRGLELLWVDDPIDQFFLQVQGSGQVQLDDGSLTRVGYASQNGHPYRAIGRDLIEIGVLTRDQVSLPAIKAWLEAHPADAPDIMARNRSYIFFEERPELGPDDGPLGAQGVSLTAGRSLAVDPRYVPLGVPVWLETTVPWPEGAAPLHRLMVAQDTGGAIKGVVRGDVFFGAGARAEAAAGHMKSPGRYALLLPKALIPVS